MNSAETITKYGAEPFTGKDPAKWPPPSPRNAAPASLFIALQHFFAIIFPIDLFKVICPNGVACMPQRPVPPEPGRDDGPGRAEEDWLAWCEALEASGQRLKQDPRWRVSQLGDGTFRWTTPTGRQYTTEPTRYPV